MYLVYINELGLDYKLQKQYQFIFSKNSEVLVEEWFMIPSSGRSLPPDIEDIDMVGTLKDSELNLELVQNSDYFGVIDAVDGIVALGWESFDRDAEERQVRLSFHFGEKLESVIEKLKQYNLNLIKEEIIFKN